MNLTNLFITLSLLGISAIIIKRIKFLHEFNIPPSLVLSIPVLIFATLHTPFSTTPLFQFWKEIPGIFIALVFTGLFLQKPLSKKNSTFSDLAGQTSLVMIIALGQMVIGILLTFFFLTPVFQVPASFAQILETGFTGGHGTAVAMGPIYAQFHLTAGLDFGLFSATVGLLFGTIAGIYIIKRQKGELHLKEESWLKEEEAVITLHSLLVTSALIATAFLGGMALRSGFEQFLAQSQSIPISLKNIQIPLFVFCMVSGFLLRKFLSLVYPVIIENHTLQVLGDFFLELLIFAGIATINLKLISDMILPLMFLMSLGILWNVYCYFRLQPYFIKPSIRFPLGLINFGMTSGTTATGLMLLKIASPRHNPTAVKVFAESAVFTQPLVGGGLLTLSMPMLVTVFHPLLVAGILFSFILLFYFLGTFAQRRAI